MAWHKTITLALALLGAIIFPSNVHGQQAGYILEGEISNLFEGVTNATLDPTLANAQTFRIEVIYDTSVAAVPGSDSTYAQLNDSVLSISFEVYDELGNPIDSPFNDPISRDTASNYDAIVEAWHYPNQSDYLLIAVAKDTDRGLGFYLDQNQLFLTSTLPYPMLTEGSDLSIIGFGFWSNLPESYIQSTFQMTSITAMSFSLDNDNDGVDDALDNCSASLLDTYVEFNGGFDSGVPNYVDANGCSIMDYYAACARESEQETIGFSLFQPRYYGPSHCEKQVSYHLVAAGLIDLSEARMLRDAMYMSYRSGDR